MGRSSILSLLLALVAAALFSGCIMDSGGYYGYRGDDYGDNYYRDAGRRNGWHRGGGESEGWGRRSDSQNQQHDDGEEGADQSATEQR